MTALAALLLLAAAPAGAQIAPMNAPVAVGTRPTGGRVSAGLCAPLEKRFNMRLATLFDVTDPLDLLGNARGVYIAGFGVVFTAEVSLVTTPALTPFRPRITKEEADRIRKKKIERLPSLKTAMKEMMHSMAATLVQVPDNDQMVLVVRFYYEPWEDMNGMPSQVLMRASRKDALAGDIQVEEQ